MAYGKKQDMKDDKAMASKAAKAEVKKHEARMHKGKKPVKMANGGCVAGISGTGRRYTGSN